MSVLYYRLAEGGEASGARTALQGREVSSKRLVCGQAMGARPSYRMVLIKFNMILVIRTSTCVQHTHTHIPGRRRDPVYVVFLIFFLRFWLFIVYYEFLIRV